MPGVEDRELDGGLLAGAVGKHLAKITLLLSPGHESAYKLGRRTSEHARCCFRARTCSGPAVEGTASAPLGAMSRTELIIQLVKVVIGLAFGAYFLWWSLEVLDRLPPQ